MSGIHVLVINGPNLNLLGTREPQTYGYDTLSDVEEKCKRAAEAAGGRCSTFQSNYEGAIVERIHHAKADGVDGIVINAGAYTHTSVAIRDALLGVTIPFIELHISNVHARESFRHHSYLSDKAVAVVCGLGVSGYDYCVTHVCKTFKKRE
ncbi:hypothetical protein FFLO_03170 [Filobasidium floriforme]|uniref:Catabolic 3-dehydroquinase n=1 Tax=Filobasidium floriforme TaxID=5210 RepID=A0A8K0NQJ5_9TREE|nr:hypothetical protein FFLO_03170 [Filobasidium floriforme]